MNNEAIIQFILKRPKNYPGKHNESHPRTF
jgi:hypothetical protein